MSDMENHGIKLHETQTEIQKLLLDFSIRASLKCAIDLGIPDVIHKHGKPLSLSEITSSLPINPSKSHHIHHLMRFLVNGGFFLEQGDGRYALSPASRILLKDQPFMSGQLFLAHDPVMTKPWNSLTDWFKNDDRSPFETARGENFWDYSAQEPQFPETFHQAMSGDSNLIARVLLHDFNNVFEGLTSLVDVGGGTGALARAISKTFPSLKCIVYDLPPVVSNQQGTDNLIFVGGNMFDSIPTANAILLKSILHDWSDENCVKIVKTCKEANGDGKQERRS